MDTPYADFTIANRKRFRVRRRDPANVNNFLTRECISLNEAEHWAGTWYKTYGESWTDIFTKGEWKEDGYFVRDDVWESMKR